MRSSVETMMTRLPAGETDLAGQLVHPEFVTNLAAPKRRNGPSGAAATSEWLRSCFGSLHTGIRRIPAVRDDLGMLVQLGLVPPPRPAGDSAAPG